MSAYARVVVMIMMVILYIREFWVEYCISHNFRRNLIFGNFGGAGRHLI